MPHGGEDQEAATVASAPAIWREILFVSRGQLRCAYLLGFYGTRSTGMQIVIVRSTVEESSSISIRDAAEHPRENRRSEVGQTSWPHIVISIRQAMSLGNP
jgi:hypothetical protein